MKLAGNIFTVLLVLLCFLHNPLALLSPLGGPLSELVYYFEFPHIFTASALSVCYIFLNIESINLREKYIKVAVAALGLIVISSVVNGSSFFRFIEAASFVTVPIAGALALKDERNKKILIYGLSFLFILNLFYCFAFNGKIGIAANQNWLAATLAGTFPFLLIVLKKVPSKAFAVVALILAAALSIILIRTSARSLIPALGVYLLLLSFHRWPLKVNISIWALVAVLCGSLVVVKKSSIERSLNFDVRGPLSQDAVSMVLSSPVLGYGPGHFQKDFARFASDKLKQREVYSPIVEHPHNEFLHLSASVGLPAALCWLILLFFLFAKKEKFPTQAAQAAVCLLFVMGLADKPLVVSPSAMVFLLAMACCLPGGALDVEKRELLQPVRMGLGGAALLLAVFSLLIIKVKVSSNYHLWKGDVYAEYYSASGNTQKYIPLILEHYSRSSDIDISNSKAAYAATSVGLQFYKNVNVSRKYLDRLLDTEPDYSDSHYKAGLYYLKLAELLGEGAEKQEYLKEAEKECLKNVELSKWDIKRYRRMADFYVKTGQLGLCEQWILKVRQVTQEKMRFRATYPGQRSTAEELKKWKDNVLDGKYGVGVGSFKYNPKPDYLFSKFFKETVNLKRYQTEAFNDKDHRFWQERLILWDELQKAKVNSVNGLLTFLIDVQVGEESLQWPLSVLKKKKGSPLSVAALACSLNSLLGNDSAILRNSGGDVLCLLFDKKGQPYFWNCQSGVRLQSSVEAFYRLPAIQQKLGVEAQKMEYSLFTYPQAFCFRNQVLSDNVSQHEDIPVICNSPTLEYIRLQRKIGKAVGLLTEFRTLLDREP